MESDKIIIPDRLPVISVASAIMVFPSTMSYFFPRGKVVKEIIERFNDDKLAPLVLTMMSKPGSKTIPENLYSVGSVAQFGPGPEPGSVALAGIYRAKVNRLVKCDEDLYWLAEVVPYEDSPEEHFLEDDEGLINSRSFIVLRTLLAKTKTLMARLISESEGVDDLEASELEELLGSFDNYDFNHRCKSEVYKVALDQFIWQVLSVLPQANSSEKQEMIESQTLTGRLGEVLNLLVKNLEMVVGTQRLNQMLVMEAARRRRNKKYRDTGSGGDSKELIAVDKDNDFDSQFMDSVGPGVAEKYKKFMVIRDSIANEKERAIFVEAAMKDFNRVKSFGLENGDRTEVAMINNHLDFILALPWGKEAPRREDFREFESIFESEHFGLEKIKDEVSDHVAVRRKHPDGKGRVLCFVGPPGVGKTSVCKSIAKGQGLEYVRISLGGVRDEADIRGHRMTYIGALPGNIMKGMKSAGVKNIVFVLDEIDKIGTDSFRGDPAAALLEVLDPEQNHSFVDHYLDVPFDLSKVLFIATANTVSGILPALRDRMDIILFSGYTEEEKVQIAKKFLVPKVLAEVGLNKEGFQLKWQDDNPDEMLLYIIRGYTKEAGVRDIERKLAKITRRIVKDDERNPGYAEEVVITKELVDKIHGRPKIRGRANKTVIGEAIGLVVDEVGGGDITYVQAKLSVKTSLMDKSISQTDEAGAALYKSTQRAITVAKGKIEDCPEIINKLKTHLINAQVSDSFTPTDGPSAGITVAVAVISELKKQLVKPYVAMTGALALTGRVKAVGGIKEKVIAAANSGLKEVILPESNRKDYDEEVPKSAKDKLKKVHFVEDIDQVLEIVLLDKDPT